jgi:hypothetical protein
MNIKETLERLINVPNPSDNVVLGIATEVDDTKFLCKVSPTNGDADLLDVRLCPDTEAENKGFILIPKENSFVYVIMDNAVTGFVAMVSEIENVIFNCDKIVFNNGDLGGMVKINDLITKLNNIENKLNALMTSYKSHTHTHSQGNTGTAIPPFTQQNLTLTQKNDLENEKIKQ